MFLGQLHGKVLRILMKTSLQTNVNLVSPWKILNNWGGCGVVAQKPGIPACGGSSVEAGGPWTPNQAKTHSKTSCQNKKEEVHINWRPDDYSPWCSGRGLWSPQRDTHQHHHKAQRSSLFNSNSTFMRFHLCAVFRSQLMFALGGAESLFAGQSGNSEGRDRGQQKRDAVFSWRPAVTLGGLWTWSKYHSSP